MSTQETRAFLVWITPKVVGAAMVVVGIFLTYNNTTMLIGETGEIIRYDQLMGIRIPTGTRDVIAWGLMGVGAISAFWDTLKSHIKST